MAEKQQIRPDYPAFPHSYANGEYVTDHGMNIRTWLAGMAMKGIIAGDIKSDIPINKVAEGAVMYADALIAELNEP